GQPERDDEERGDHDQNAEDCPDHRFLSSGFLACRARVFVGPVWSCGTPATSAGAAPFIDGHTVLPGFTRAGPRRERKLGPRVEASICARRAIDLGSRLTIALRLLPDDRHWNA